MKRTKRLFALLTASALIFTAAPVFGLDVTTKDYNLSIGSIAEIKYPQVGVGSIDKKIADSVSNFESKYGGEFDDIATDYIVVTYSTADDSDRYAQIEVSVRTALNPASSESATYYIDKENNSEIADKSAYDAALQEEADALAAAEAEAAEGDEDEDDADEDEDEGEESGEVTEQLLAELVPLFVNLEPLGFTRDDVIWDESAYTVTILSDADEVTLIIDEDYYIVGDEAYELGVAPTIVNDYTYVPVSFFTNILGAAAVVEDGQVAFLWAE